MDKVGYNLEQFNILNYKTTNRIGYQNSSRFYMLIILRKRR
ncbi:type IV secretion protein [Streptococcus ruminantium]|uniref:Type IV secretion protein n=1 Tax=Streptococcus ruminantium TaxID=1917441 RepID=A0A2Z5TNK4_9STRE|nr:type IV secretion protein [Streptococcus ruminantium]